MLAMLGGKILYDRRTLLLYPFLFLWLDFFVCHVISEPNEKGQRPEPAATDVPFVCGPSGWLRLDAPFG
jgi:hypothetical protein